MTGIGRYKKLTSLRPVLKKMRNVINFSHTQAVRIPKGEKDTGKLAEGRGCSTLLGSRPKPPTGGRASWTRTARPTWRQTVRLAVLRFKNLDFAFAFPNSQSF